MELGPLQLLHQSRPLLLHILQGVSQRILKHIYLVGEQQVTPVQLQLDLCDGLRLLFPRGFHLKVHILEGDNLL